MPIRKSHLPFDRFVHEMRTALTVVKLHEPSLPHAIERQCR